MPVRTRCYMRHWPPERVHESGNKAAELHCQALPTVCEAEFIPVLKELLPRGSKLEEEDVMKKPAAHVSKKPAAHVSTKPAAHVAKKPAAHVSKKPAAHVAKKPAAHVVKQPATQVVKVGVGRTFLGSVSRKQGAKRVSVKSR